MAIVVVWLGFDGVAPRDSASMWAISFVATNFVAYVLYRYVDRSVNDVRDRIRE